MFTVKCYRNLFLNLIINTFLVAYGGRVAGVTSEAGFMKPLRLTRLDFLTVTAERIVLPALIRNIG